MSAHKFDIDSDRCTCGEEVHYLEEVGTHGCGSGVPWWGPAGQPTDGRGRPVVSNREWMLRLEDRAEAAAARGDVDEARRLEAAADAAFEKVAAERQPTKRTGGRR